MNLAETLFRALCSDCAGVSHLLFASTLPGARVSGAHEVPLG